MTTVGGGAVSFQLDRGTIVAKHSNGAVARIAGEPVESDNGLAVPIDSVLIAPDFALAPASKRP